MPRAPSSPARPWPSGASGSGRGFPDLSVAAAIHEVHTRGGAAGSAQEAIKGLGTNGGGFFNANSSHPFENPTPLSDLLEMVLIFAIPAGLTYTYGRMAGSQRQGWAIFLAMAVLFLAGVTAA